MGRIVGDDRTGAAGRQSPESARRPAGPRDRRHRPAPRAARRPRRLPRDRRPLRGPAARARLPPVARRRPDERRLAGHLREGLGRPARIPRRRRPRHLAAPGLLSHLSRLPAPAEGPAGRRGARRRPRRPGRRPRRSRLARAGQRGARPPARRAARRPPPRRPRRLRLRHGRRGPRGPGRDRRLAPLAGTCRHAAALRPETVEEVQRLPRRTTTSATRNSPRFSGRPWTRRR